MQSFYNCLKRAGGTVKPGIQECNAFAGGLAWYSRGMNRSEGSITSLARLSFYNAFGITPDLQMELENYYDSVNLQLEDPVPLDTRQVSSNELINGFQGH